VPIKASSARQIETLLADLGSDRTATREAAVARLTLLGARAVDRLLLLVDSNASAGTRASALRALEAIADPRALDGVLDAVDADDPAVACAAASAVRVFLRGPRGNVAVDRLTTAVMDTARNEDVRIAALGALGDLERSTLAPLLDALRRDPSDAIKAATTLSATVDPGALVTRAADRGLPQDPEELGLAVSRAGAAVALPLLLRVIERVRDREASEPAARRAEWTRVRGRAHVALAARGSRIALYDLRESLESTSAASARLPVEFLTALSTAGDASCLESVAAAYARSARLTRPTGSTGSTGSTGPTGSTGRKGPPSQAARNPGAPGDAENRDWWRDRLADAFKTIVKREGLTGRHAVMRKIRKRWPEILRGA
jgi:HEAT repeat protein